MRKIQGGWVKLCVLGALLFNIQVIHASMLKRWSQSTISSLNKLRSETALIIDTLIFEKTPTGEWKPIIDESITSPTNMALDLLLQLDILEHDQFSSDEQALALSVIDRSLDSLAALPFDPESGLFYGWYEPSHKRVLIKNLSSVDNLHLALAFWTAKERLDDPIARQKAENLFNRMNFSIFLDREKKLIIGNLISDNNGGWKSEGYYYSNYGSEARSIYILGYVLGLFGANDSEIVIDSLKLMNFEVSETTKSLKLWDGGAFQLFLPDLLISERSYSDLMKSFFKNYSKRMTELGNKYPEKIPAAHSACFFKDHEHRFFYNGSAGILSETSSENQGTLNPKKKELWEAAFTPHALFLASLDLTPNSLAKLEKLENIQENGLSFYNHEYGWLDAWQWKNKEAPQLVNLQIALDQAMIALSINRLTAKDRLSVSARALRDNPRIRARLERYYKELSQIIHKSL